jgi:PhnB protein
MDAPSLIPVLAVADIQEAINFYSKLGFVEEKEYTFTGDNDTVVHAQLRKGGSVLFLGRRDTLYYQGSRADRVSKADHPERGLGITLILQTEKLEDVLKIVKDAALEILYGPADEWYGDKVFLFVDPFGYEWKISQPSSGR